MSRICKCKRVVNYEPMCTPLNVERVPTLTCEYSINFLLGLISFALSIEVYLRASCLMLEINKFRCYETKIEESEKASSHRELNPGHLWLEPPVLGH